MRYNPDTDTVQIYYNDQWIDWKYANIQVINIFKNGQYNDDSSYFGAVSGTSYSQSSYIIYSGEPSGVFKGILISVNDLLSKISNGKKKLHIIAKASTTISLIADSGNSSCNWNNGKHQSTDITSAFEEYIFDLSTMGFTETYKYIFLGMYGNVGCGNITIY